MKLIYRVALVVACFFAAIACYVFGVPVGGAVFIVLGLVFEALFWTGIFGKKKKVVSSASK